MYEIGEQFKINMESLKSLPAVVFKGEKYRITILSERLIRLEYNKLGIFNDSATLLVKNRNFRRPSFVKDDSKTFLKIKTKYFELSYLRDTSFSPKTLSVINLSKRNNDKFQDWYYGDKDVRNFKGSAMALDGMNKMPNLKNGLFSPSGYTIIDDSNSLLLDENSNLKINNNKGIDIYLFMYGNDFGLCLKDYYILTGYPELIPRYALGNWWSKNYDYNDENIIEEIDHFKKNNVPISLFLLDNTWAKTDLKKYKNIDYGFTFDETKFKNPMETIAKIHSNGVKFGLKVNPYYGFYPFEQYFNEIKKYFKINKQGYFDFNPYDPRMMDLYMKILLHPLLNMNVDMFWSNYYSKNSEDMFIISDYMTKDLKRNGKRPLLLARNCNIAAHRYNVLYSGNLNINWDVLRMLPYFTLTATNLGISWWSHDIGGSVGGIEDNELYIRSIQLGVFSPILRFNTEKGNYYKREPWKWDLITNKIATDFLQLRHKLIPYIYSEAYKYHKEGSPLIIPLYYTNLDLYDNPIYVNQYLFGRSFMISPIIEKMDDIINRTIQKFFIPEGVWYDFITGKKFIGNKKHIAFYPIESYPVFVKAGSIIPMAGEKSYKSVKNPVDLEIHVFPGVNNTYNLYEDDGETYKYLEGNYSITKIDYNYRTSNYTVIVKQIDDVKNVIPIKRDYKVVFRDTKKADNVMAYLNNQAIPYETEVTETDFIVKVKDIPTNEQLVINCYGKDIEIDATKVIKDDIDSILSDLKIETVMKDSIADIVFSDMNLNKKRIAIRRLSHKGLDKRNIKIFLRLVDYMEQN